MIRLCFNPQLYLSPKPWEVGEVVPLCGSGSLLGFCALRNSGEAPEFAESLPVEIFNHEFKNILKRTPEQAADFMSKFGIIGASGVGGDNGFARLYLGELLLAIARAIKEADKSMIDSLMREYQREAEDDYSLRLVSLDEIKSIYEPELTELDQMEASNRYIGIYAERLRAMAIAVERVARETGKKPASVVSFVEFRDTVKDLSNMADAIKAVCLNSKTSYQESSPGEKKSILNAVELMNVYLRFVSPTISVIDDSSGKELSPPPGLTAPGQSCFEVSFCLQLWRFAMIANESGCKVCRKCGNVFAEKRSNKKTSARRVDAEFCCDKCQNAAAQQRYRDRARATRENAATGRQTRP